MSLSFKDSLEQSSSENTEISTTSVGNDVNMESMPVMAYSLRSVSTLSSLDGWTPIEDKGYRFYNDEYSDENYSNVDELKNIILDSNQFNITQEQNSQYIPFKMPRYYDGFDLTKTELSIYYINKNKEFHTDIPVDVYYNDEYIRFAWLVSQFATKVAGMLQFEIHAKGINNKGESYTWKSKPVDKLNVLQSLESVTVGEIGLSEEEVEGWFNKIQLESQNAQTAAASAQSSANEAASLVATLQDGIATEVEAAVNVAVESLVDGMISDQLVNYYDKSETYNKDEIDNAIAAATPEGYATVEYVDEQIDNIDVTEQLNDYALKTELNEQLENYSLKTDVEEQLNSYALKTDVTSMIASNPQDFATKQEVSDAIEAQDITSKLDNYYTKEETYSQSEVDEKLDNVSVDLTGYATEKYVDDKASNLSSTISTNTENISSLSTTVGGLQSTINSIDTSPRLTYDVVYNDTEDADVGENVFVFYEIENEGKENEVREAKKKFTIVGGGGGGATSSTLKIGYVTTSPLVVTTNDKAIITYTFSGTDSSGDVVPEGTATWKVAGRTVATNTAISGENSFDITEYLSIGTQKVNLSIVDEAGSLVTKTWTVQKIDVRLESTFNDTLTYPIGTISFDYTPYGAISKNIHFILDGTEIGVVTSASSGIPMAYEIPEQEHGAHLLEVYMDAEINGNTIESNHIVKDIIWYDSTSTTPVISTVYQNFTARQYDSTNIEYTVYDPTTETPTVEIAVDGNVVSTPTLSKATNIYSYKTDVVGKHIITISCGDTIKTLNVDITKLDINISPVTAGLAFDFNPSGKSNNDTDRVWSNGTVSMSVSDNFDWVNGGYQFDENGDQYFCIKAGTSATIDYQLFADDAKKNGKEMKLVFKTTNVAKPDATFLSCMDNTTDSDHVGIQMDVHEAYIYGQGGKLHLPYSEEDIIEFEFNISKNTESIPMVMGYEDGVSTCPMVYDDSYNFTQNTPKVISLGSEDCDLHIYRFKVYNTSLTDRGILNNFIADARNAEEMISRYDRNQIYDENGGLDPDVLAEKCPWLRIIKLEAPYFTNNKSDKVPNTKIEYIYKNGDPILDNWIAYDCLHSGQGTSSNNYGASGRNLDLIIKSNSDFGNSPYIVLGDGSQVNKVSLTRNSVPVNYFNVKVNIASSENANNALLQRRYNEYNPYNRAFVREEGYDISTIKDTMEFHNCVIFIKETNTDMTTHREFADNDWHFYAIGNIGDSKKTDDTRLTDPDDRYECVVEIMDVELALSDFPVGDEAISILEADNFDEKGTYGWRYIWEDGTDEENAEVAAYCKQKWIDFYKFVVNSTDEEFKNHLGDYFVLDSALYYYLFTTRYTMVDNRAKNSFWHYGKTGEVDSDGNPIRKWDLSFDYDNDTSLGINNYGDMVFRYGLEDTDVDEKGEEIFRESDSTFFCRLRDLFADELKAMYNTLESQNAWHGESLINQFDEWQSEFPEELWRVDIERKYIRTYNSSFINGAGDSQFLVNMAHGKKKYQRRQYERNQEKYMASKYQSSVASSDNAVLRCTVPTGDLVIEPNYKVKLTPYAYMYLNVKYGTQNPIQLRAEPNVEYEIPFEGNSADIIDIYSASLIQSFGDLSSCYAATIDTSKASKVKELIIGNETEGYDNPSLTTLTTGANYLLEKLNIENVSGLTQSLNLSALNNLRELYAHGSNIGGVTFADGGKIEIAELPTINAMTMKNLIYLSTLDITGFDRLTTLTVENCNTVDLLTILNSANNINRVRIVGVDWSLENTDILERLYSMKGIDKNGYNTDQSVLSGKVHVPVIRQQQLYNYQSAWSDLEVTFDTMIEQYAVTFMNADGSVLEIQYVDKGEDAIDPTKREVNPLSPVIESTVSHDFTFAGWDSSLTDVFTERTITAIYSESLRSYTIKYVSKGITLQESTGLYGDNVPYTGVNPVYTAEESGYVYYLFNRWDKSGFIDGEKTVNAIFDKFEYTATSFDGKELADLSPVEIYAMNKLGLAESVITDKDQYSFVIGNDIEYDDIESELLISEKTYFDGSNHIDTGIQLFDEDKDFVLAIDYEFLSGNTSNSVLAQCFQANGTNGFKLWYSKSNEFDGARFTWGTTSNNVIDINKREIIIIRHKKGDNNIIIYKSNLDCDEILTAELTRTKSTIGSGTLVFGSARADDGIYENHAIGNIHWAKVWYRDLGDDVCKSLAMWTHESITLEACGFRKYYLTDNTSKRCSFSLLASHLLGRTKKWNPSNTNIGGWANSALNKSLNTRLYNAMPLQIRELLKRVIVHSSIGNMSYELASSDCYITIPSVIEVDSTINAEPYNSEGTAISYLNTNASRKRSFDNGDYNGYWLRSPNVQYANYIWRVDENGTTQGITNASSSLGVLIEISF